MDFNLALKLYTAEQVRNGEILAAQMAGVSMYSLMQRAGMAVYERFLHLYPRARTVLVVCGKLAFDLLVMPSELFTLGAAGGH